MQSKSAARIAVLRSNMSIMLLRRGSRESLSAGSARTAVGAGAGVAEMQDEVLHAPLPCELMPKVLASASACWLVQ